MQTTTAANARREGDTGGHRATAHARATTRASKRDCAVADQRLLYRLIAHAAAHLQLQEQERTIDLNGEFGRPGQQAVTKYNEDGVGSLLLLLSPQGRVAVKIKRMETALDVFEDRKRASLNAIAPAECLSWVHYRHQKCRRACTRQGRNHRYNVRIPWYIF